MNGGKGGCQSDDYTLKQSDHIHLLFKNPQISCVGNLESRPHLLHTQASVVMLFDFHLIFDHRK